MSIHDFVQEQDNFFLYEPQTLFILIDFLPNFSVPYLDMICKIHKKKFEKIIN